MNLTYEQAKTEADKLDGASKAAGAILSAFPKGPMGLTPDEVKASAEWIAAKAAFDRAFEAQRSFNGWYTVAYKKERARDRAARVPVTSAA